jgi:hypothetical protein
MPLQSHSAAPSANSALKSAVCEMHASLLLLLLDAVMHRRDTNYLQRHGTIGELDSSMRRLSSPLKLCCGGCSRCTRSTLAVMQGPDCPDSYLQQCCPFPHFSPAAADATLAHFRRTGSRTAKSRGDMSLSKLHQIIPGDHQHGHLRVA